MKRHIKSFDNSAELLVQRWKSGVRMITPDIFNHTYSDKNDFFPLSVKKLFEMPFNVYFLNCQSVIQNMSDRTANICGFQQVNDAIGNTARAVSKRESAEFSIRHNNEVISRNSVVIKDEHFLRLDDFEFQDISIKFPLLNEEEKIIGVFGCSIILDSPAQAVNSLLETGLLAPINLFEGHQNCLPIYLNPDQHDFNDLNNRPRKSLSFATPNEVFNSGDWSTNEQAKTPLAMLIIIHFMPYIWNNSRHRIN